MSVVKARVPPALGRSHCLSAVRSSEVSVPVKVPAPAAYGAKVSLSAFEAGERSSKFPVFVRLATVVPDADALKTSWFSVWFSITKALPVGSSSLVTYSLLSILPTVCVPIPTLSKSLGYMTPPESVHLDSPDPPVVTQPQFACVASQTNLLPQ